MHKCAKTQPTAAAIPHIIAKYVPDTNMPTALDIYIIHGQNLMCIYVPHIKHVN